MEESPFEEEEIVWAKIGGFPWWPASILECHPRERKVMVNFVNDHSHAKLDYSVVRAWEDYELPSNQRKNNKKLARAEVIGEEIRSGKKTFLEAAREWLTEEQRRALDQAQKERRLRMESARKSDTVNSVVRSVLEENDSSEEEEEESSEPVQVPRKRGRTPKNGPTGRKRGRPPKERVESASMERRLERKSASPKAFRKPKRMEERSSSSEEKAGETGSGPSRGETARAGFPRMQKSVGGLFKPSSERAKQMDMERVKQGGNVQSMPSSFLRREEEHMPNLFALTDEPESEVPVKKPARKVSQSAEKSPAKRGRQREGERREVGDLSNQKERKVDGHKRSANKKREQEISLEELNGIVRQEPPSLLVLTTNLSGNPGASPPLLNEEEGEKSKIREQEKSGRKGKKEKGTENEKPKKRGEGRTPRKTTEKSKPQGKGNRGEEGAQQDDCSSIDTNHMKDLVMEGEEVRKNANMVDIDLHEIIPMRNVTSKQSISSAEPERRQREVVVDPMLHLIEERTEQENENEWGDESMMLHSAEQRSHFSRVERELLGCLEEFQRLERSKEEAVRRLGGKNAGSGSLLSPTKKREVFERFFKVYRTSDIDKIPGDVLFCNKFGYALNEICRILRELKTEIPEEHRQVLPLVENTIMVLDKKIEDSVVMSNEVLP
jgi:hypothetical protein